VKTRTWIIVSAAAALLGGCDGSAPRSASPAQAVDASFQEFGDYEIHYNALRTDSLAPDIARTYGIQRSANRVMLNVSVLHKEADQAPRRPVEADVGVDAYNLNGQLKNMRMRRVSEGEAIYYIGEATIAGSEILVFDISVLPTGQSMPMRVKFKREFVSN
jgi:hypothetical protein